MNALGYDGCCDTCSCNGGYQYFREIGSKVPVWWVRYIALKEDPCCGKEAELGVCVCFI